MVAVLSTPISAPWPTCGRHRAAESTCPAARRQQHHGARHQSTASNASSSPTRRRNRAGSALIVAMARGCTASGGDRRAGGGRRRRGVHNGPHRQHSDTGRPIGPAGADASHSYAPRPWAGRRRPGRPPLVHAARFRFPPRSRQKLARGTTEPRTRRAFPGGRGTRRRGTLTGTRPRVSPNRVGRAAGLREPEGHVHLIGGADRLREPVI